jgi:hypothetical protein
VGAAKPPRATHSGVLPRLFLPQESARFPSANLKQKENRTLIHLFRIGSVFHCIKVFCHHSLFLLERLVDAFVYPRCVSFLCNYMSLAVSSVNLTRFPFASPKNDKAKANGSTKTYIFNFTHFRSNSTPPSYD